MEFRKVLALRGPNVWANSPVMEVWVDLKELDRPSTDFPGFNDRLMSWMPTMIEHECSIGERGGFFQRLRDGTYPGHILEHVTLELQSLVYREVGFGRARETSEPGVYRVVFKYHDERLARECLDVGRELVLAALHDRPFDVKAEIDRLRRFAHEVCLGPSTSAIVDAAKALGIPAWRMNDESLVQLGQGSKLRRIRAAESDGTGAIAEAIAQDKELARTLLKAAGVPVPEGRQANDAEDAWEAACEIGVPVVLKPRDGNQGRGVTTNLSTREQIVAAYDAALAEGSQVIVEKFAPGHDYRLLVVGGRVIAAARREPAQVLGDGVHTIRDLIEIANLDPRRGEHHATAASKIKLDAVSESVLADQGYACDSVPPAGTSILIRRNGNLSTGGTAIDMTERVHPQVAARAVDAARMIGLDIAGVDVVAPDISAPLEEQSGVVVEVNAAPGLRMHVQPSVGVSRPVGEAIVSMLFPNGDDGRIPIAAVTGTNGKTTTTRFIAYILRGTSMRVGMTCTDGIYIDGRRIDTSDCAGPRSSRAVLMNPTVDAAVFETARGGIIREGLGFDRCDVAVVTNIGEGDHLGLNEVHTLEALVKVKRCIVDVVPPNGTSVLNANDPLCVAMAPHSLGKIRYFALDGNHPVIVRHRDAGGQAIFVRDGMIVVAEGAKEEEFLPIDRVPLTRGGTVTFHVENALAAIAAALAMKIPADVIRSRVESFTADIDKVPTRFNIFEIQGRATVIIDYGHNVDALAALIPVLDQFPHQRRTCVYTTPGDRRDCDMVRQGELLGNAFDHVVLYEYRDRRGRADGEIFHHFRIGLAKSTRVKQVDEVRGADEAAEFALRQAKPGELILLQSYTADETVSFIRNYVESIAPEPALDDSIAGLMPIVAVDKPAEVVQAAGAAIEKF